MSYAVDETWEIDLGTGPIICYRLVYEDRPQIIAGYVFMPFRGPADFRQVDGKPENDYEVQRAWRSTILDSKAPAS